MASETVPWTDLNLGEDGYRVKWGTVSGTYPNSADVGANVTEYRITGLTTGVTYYWIVMALVDSVEQTPSGENSFVAFEQASYRHSFRTGR